MKPDPCRFQLILALWLICIYAPAQALTIRDSENNLIQFDKPFERIISLYPAHTENLCSLGGCDKLIGVGKSDNYPAPVSSKPRFSYHDNTEKFLAASPDLILIRPMISRSQPELIRKLKASGITIVSLQPTSIDEMLAYWQTLGQLTGRAEAADKMVTRFLEEVGRFKLSPGDNPDCRPGVYFESIHSKMKTFAPGSISIFVLETAGGRNIAQDATGRNNSNIAPYGKERILSQAADIDVFLSQVGRMNRVTIEEIYREPGFSLIKAVRNKNIFLIEEELVSRPTLRILEGIARIQAMLYPGTSAGDCSPLITLRAPHSQGTLVLTTTP